MRKCSNYALWRSSNSAPIGNKVFGETLTVSYPPWRQRSVASMSSSGVVSAHGGGSHAAGAERPLRQFPARAVHPIWLYLMLCGVVAGCVDLGHIHWGHQADSIVPILVSLQRWTPFYWQGDRIGMLLPLLAAPFHHPLTNLLVQDWLGTFSGLAGFFLLARYVLRDRFWPAAATLVTTYLLVFVPPGTRFTWFVEQQYGTSLTLTVAALLILEGYKSEPSQWPRLPGAILLIVAANWVNFAASIIFIPFIIFRSLLGLLARAASVHEGNVLINPLRGRKVLYDVGLLVLGTVSGRAMSHFLARDVVDTASFASIPLAKWPGAWHRFAISTWNAVFTGLSCLIFLIPATAGAILLFTVPTLRPFRRKTLMLAAALLGAAVPYWLLIGTLAHVQANLYFPRYAFPSLVFISLAVAVFANVPFGLLPCTALRYCFGVSAVLLLSAAIYSYGLPSVIAVRRDIEHRFGTYSKDILQSQIDLIAGSYARVWPAVFHANLLLYEKGEHRQIYGLTLRGEPTRIYWSKIPLPRLRVAILAGDNADAQYWLHNYGLALTEVEHYPEINVLAYRPASAKAGSPLVSY